MKNLLLILALAILGTAGCKDKQEQLCEGIICENGGECINGDCDCLEGYEGPSCESQTTPNRITVTSITIAEFPLFDNGSSWDVSSAADLKVVVYRGRTVIHSQLSVFKNTTGEENYRYVPATPIDITSPTDRHAISLFDEDSFDADDFMGGVEFSPYFNTNDFPSTLRVAAGGVSFILEVKYVW